MASRNMKPSSVQGFDSPNVNDKMQSSTLKRQPSPDWSKTDLLRLLSYFEGELQARDITIATLKAEKAKQLLYQAKYGRFGLGDPFVALQRDAEGKNDTGFDEAAIKSMYDNQLAQLENLIATQRKAQLKMREQLGNSEKRFHKVCSELEEEKQKHAQDTAQGDDVTYMLEKERERLKAEIDFEKSQNKKLEKDLKKTLASLEEERSNASRHKQVAIMLIKERKNLIERIVAENHLRDEMETALTDGKSKIQNMAEGLAQESKKALKMEAVIEKQSTKFDTERETLCSRLQNEEAQTNTLKAEVARLSKQLESLQQQVRSNDSSPTSVKARSSVSPARAGNPSQCSPSGATSGVVQPLTGSTLQPVSPSVNNNSPQAYSPASSGSTVTAGVRPAAGQQQTQASRTYAQSSNRVTDGGRIGSNSPEREVIYRPENTTAGITAQRASNAAGIKSGGTTIARVDNLDSETGSGLKTTSASPEPTATVTSHGRGKVLPHVTAPSQIRKPQGIGSPSGLPIGRGTPPPIPPNKPNYVTPGPNSCKPSPPKKVTPVQTSGKDSYSGQYSQTPTKGPYQQAQRMVQIPVTVVGNSSSSSTSSSSLPAQGDASVHTQVRETSPSAVKKTSQCVVDSTSLEHSSTSHAVVAPLADSSHALEFLGPEMANLQLLLAAMSTGEASESSAPVTNGNTSSAAPSFATPSLITSPSQLPLSKVMTLSNTSQNLQASSYSNSTDEQNNNKVKAPRSHQEIKSTAKATAQVSPIISKSQATTLHIFDKQPTTRPSFLLSHNIVPPTLVNSHTPSPKNSPTISNSLLNIPSTTAVTISPTVRPKNIPLRPRSKSPQKAPHNHSRSYSASARISTDILAPVTSQPHSTRWILSASPIPSLRPSPAMEVHGSPLHHLSALGKVEALSKILTERKGDANSALKDGTTPLHCAAENNQEASIKILLQNGAKPSSLRDDRVTPLHIAALKGYTSCVRLLLSKGAAVNLSTTSNLAALHLAVKAGHIECCRLLLRHGANILFTGQDGLTSLHYAVQNNQPEMLKSLLDKLKFTGVKRESATAHQIVAVTDKDGWTIAHMAAHLQEKECLVMLAESLPLDFEVKDKLARSVRKVASAACKELMAGTDQAENSAIVKATIELRNIQEGTTVSSVQVGTIEVGPGLSWVTMEDLLQGTIKSYLSQLNTGLKTRRIARLDADLDRVDRDFTLGLTMANIKHFEIGFYKWVPGMKTDTSPYVLLSNSELKKVTITVNDCDNMCELIAFDVLHPVSNISNYLRLMEQYKSVIFYGPAGSGKSYLAHRMAQSIAAREVSLGRKPAIYQLSLHSGYTYASFLAYLKQRNCVVSVSRTNENFAPILLLDNLEMVDMAQLFGELLDPMEYRGIGHAFRLRGDVQGHSGLHYLADQFYVIGTMNKSRSLGVDLSILPRFRWVQFRLDTEPLRGLLGRHFFRRIFNTYRGCMPSPEDPVFRAIEWIVCVWQRLNDSLNKLGIPEVIQGPCMFFKCPLEKQDHKLILQWMQNTWNQQIAPRVREAVKRGTGSEAPSDGQQKVANTALYVLMQRSVIQSCPLSGQDKDAYFAGFSASNELDIPLRSGDSKPRGAPTTFFSPNSPRNTNQQRRPNSVESSMMQSLQWTSDGESCHGPASDFKMRSRNGKESHSDSSAAALNIKRRSLSDSSVNKAAQEEERQHQRYLDGMGTPTSSQAKMAKLEMKSPKIVNIASAFRSPSLSSSETSPTGVQLKKTGYVSPLVNLVVDNSHTNPKKSKSSENISSSGLYGASGRLRSPGPFPFSLTTPTSSLSFFKFFDKTGSEGEMRISEPMPDFSVFDKGSSSPTDELAMNRSFVFVGRPEFQGKSLHDQNGGETKKEEVWSMRSDVFHPIYKSRDEEGDSFESET